MYSEARKIHLIEEMLKVKSETVLIELESVLKKAGLYKDKRQTSAHEVCRLTIKRRRSFNRCCHRRRLRTN